MNSPLWNRVTIVGCGLIGASFALALRRHNLCVRVAGWDISDVVLNEALKRNVIDEVDQSFATNGISESDLIYLAMPVNSIIAFLSQHSVAIKRGALVTDAGSTKQQICEAARQYLPEDCAFVGGHPIAGSHFSGIAHARADLLTGQPYVLIADRTRPPKGKFAVLRETIASMGARVVLMTAEEHDRAMSYVSHLPQLLSSALATTVRSKPNANQLLSVAGPGFADMTRLASSSWSVWKDIVVTNQPEISAALDEHIKLLTALNEELRSNDLDNFPQLTRIMTLSHTS